MTLRKPSVEKFKPDKAFARDLRIRGKIDEVLDSPNWFKLAIREYDGWRRRQTA